MYFSQGIRGIGVQRSNVLEIQNKAIMAGGSVVLPLDDYKYGASMEPDEDEMKQLPVRFATVLDPDGYIVELREVNETALEDVALHRSLRSDVAKIVLNVEDLDECIEFYTQVLGMKLLRRRSNVNNEPNEGAMVAYVVSC